jgi:hypothetical protein
MIDVDLLGGVCWLEDEEFSPDGLERNVVSKEKIEQT